MFLKNVAIAVVFCSVKTILMFYLFNERVLGVFHIT